MEADRRSEVASARLIVIVLTQYLVFQCDFEASIHSYLQIGGVNGVMPSLFDDELDQIAVVLRVETVLLRSLDGDGLGEGIIRLVVVHQARKQAEGQVVGLVNAVLTTLDIADGSHRHAINRWYETHLRLQELIGGIVILAVRTDLPI